MQADQAQRVHRAGVLLVATAIILVGLGWTLLWALMETTFTFYGFMGNCGPAAVDAVSSSHDPLARHCHHIGLADLAVGIGLGGLIVWGGLLLLVRGIAQQRTDAQNRKWLVSAALSAAALVVLTTSIAGVASYASGARTPTQAIEDDDFGPPAYVG